MPVRISNGCFFVEDDGKSFLPSAAEIYSVVFEGKSSLRGISVSAIEFTAFEIRFSEYVGDPYLIIDIINNHEGQEIRCEFKAKSGPVEIDVARSATALLDYGMGKDLWIPLPAGAVEEVQQTLNSLGISALGVITLAQYMKLIRLSPRTLTIADRTAEKISAAQLALSLNGNVPEGFSGSLYPYQLNGYRWLSLMRKNGLGAIIADEMGLGKTVQVICLLIEANVQNSQPNLVIAPATLLENWRRELARFAPCLSVHVHHGHRRTGFPSELKLHHVVVSTFETAVMDVSLFRNVGWDVLVIDEAQNIKNPEAKRTLQLKTIPRNVAIAVTGTPVENRLKDLWSIADFVLPSLLGSLRDFESRHPDSVLGASSLEPVVTPIILRRTISEVANDLPERIDIPQALELDDSSAAAYEEIRASSLTGGGKGVGLATLNRLRMFCTHPWLAKEFETVNAVECSVKLQRLLEILEEIVENGEKALIFTSYTGSVDLIRDLITGHFGISAQVIDGRVDIKERQAIIDKFTSEDSAATLVLNPKAAGLGLNITAATHVIHFNLEWNPATEDQASARAHRRGQTKPVTVHRLFYSSTVEEVINDRMNRKRELARAAILGTAGDSGDMDDILRALRISPMEANKHDKARDRENT
jgi:SNF2 family DNA or RNA helicase